MKKRFYCGILVIAVSFLACVCFLREDLWILATPKTVLTTSLTRIISQLEERFREDPFWVLLRTIDADGQYTANVNMPTHNKLIGRVDYDLVVQTDFNEHRLSATGTASTEKREIDLALYMDADRMAFSSDELVDGQFYGITYDSFRKDICSIPLLKLMVNDNILTNWENSINKIRGAMRSEILTPKIPDFNSKEIKALLLGVLALPCQIEKTTIGVNNEVVTCHKMDYRLEVGKIASSLTGQNFGYDTTAIVSFYLYEKSVIRIEIKCSCDEENFDMQVGLGVNPQEGPLTLLLSRHGSAVNSRLYIDVNTLRTENMHSEQWNIQNEKNGVSATYVCDYIWNLHNGEMRLRINEAPERVSFVFREQENGVFIQTDDLVGIIRMLVNNQETFFSEDDVRCAMTLSKGSSVSTPEFKNIDKWSLSDFLGLMSGIGSLIGLKLE